MGVGHLGVALGAAKAAPRMNVGWLVFAALLADFLLGIFAAMGLEHAQVPVDYASRHYLTFTFPYSHSLTALLLWGVLFGLLVSWVQGGDQRRVFVVVAALVLSHFVLDGLVHVAGLPLAGENSPKFGLALWDHLPLELALETLMAAVGVAIYLTVAGRAPVFNRLGVLVVVLLLTALTWGQLFDNTPPVPSQLNFAWIAGPLLFGAALYGLDRKRAFLAK